LKDIIDEVEKQLRSVKLQASKAQRYQEYSNRLRELRLALGLQEYHQLTQEWQSRQAELEALRAGLQAGEAKAEAGQAAARRLEESLTRLDEAVHEQEARLARARQQIASEEATLTHEQATWKDLEADLAHSYEQVTELNGRVSALAAAAAVAAHDLGIVEQQGQKHSGTLRALEDALEADATRSAELHKQIEQDKVEHLERMRHAARLQNDLVSYKAQVANLCRERDRLRNKSAQAAEHLATLDSELQELLRAEDELQARLNAARQKLADQRQEQARTIQQRDQTMQQAADLRAQRSGLTSRIDVLEGLERSHDGLGAGVREMFRLLAGTGTREDFSEDQSAVVPSHSPTLPLSQIVLGMVADLLTVPREYAPLLDVALGPTAQCFLVQDSAAIEEALRARKQSFSSRVTFLPLAALHGNQSTSHQGNGQVFVDGVVAWAADLVTCDKAGFGDLPRKLLGDNLIVRDLAVARRLWEEDRRNGSSSVRYITLQ